LGGDNPTGMFYHCPQSAGLVEHPTVPNFPNIVVSQDLG